MHKKMLVEEKIIGAALCLMVLMVAAQVLSRYVLHTSLSFTEEIVRYLFVWITFLGAGVAVYRRGHLSVAGIVRYLPPWASKWIRLLVGTTALVFAAILAVFGTGVVVLQMRTGQSTAALGMPMWIIGLAVPAGGVVLIVRLLMFWRADKGGRS